MSLTDHAALQEGVETSLGTVQQPQEGAATLQTTVRRRNYIDPDRLQHYEWQRKHLLLNMLAPDNTDDEDTWMAEVTYDSAPVNAQDNTRTLRPSRIINYSEGISTTSLMNAVRIFNGGLFIALSLINTNAGHGLFTARDIADNRFICAYEGKETEDCDEDVAKTMYIMKIVVLS